MASVHGNCHKMLRVAAALRMLQPTLSSTTLRTKTARAARTTTSVTISVTICVTTSVTISVTTISTINSNNGAIFFLVQKGSLRIIRAKKKKNHALNTSNSPTTDAFIPGTVQQDGCTPAGVLFLIAVVLIIDLPPNAKKNAFQVKKYDSKAAVAGTPKAYSTGEDMVEVKTVRVLAAASTCADAMLQQSM